jgi:hypothetical protein
LTHGYQTASIDSVAELGLEVSAARTPVPYSRFQRIAAANKDAKVPDKDDDK